MSKHTTYIYRAIAQHSGRDAGVIPHTEARTAQESRELALDQSPRSTVRVRRYRREDVCAAPDLVDELQRGTIALSKADGR